ncbi:MAG: hypothetical protein WD276_04700 [Actinomycetota bacterium]
MRARGMRRAMVPFAIALVIAVAAPAWAEINWSPESPSTRVANRTRTCNTPDTASCTDSGNSWVNGPPATAISNNGSANYLHSYWVADAPSGDTGNAVVNYGPSPIMDPGDDCTDDVDPVAGAGGYCSGVYYARTDTSTIYPVTGTATATGAPGTWTDNFRVSPRTSHADRTAIGASGQYVHAIYATQLGYYQYMCTKSPRPLFYRRNTSYGSSASWDAPVALTPASSRVDYATLYTFGANVYVLFTDSATGDIRFTQSTNNGGTWAATKTIGHTTSAYDNGAGLDCSAVDPALSESPPSKEGLSGRAGIAGNGTQVIAGWVQNSAGRTVAKISTNNGTSFGQTQVLTKAGGGSGFSDSGGCATGVASDCSPTVLNAAADSDGAGTGRVAIAWVNDVGGTPAGGPAGVYARFWLESSGWGPARLIACLSPSGTTPGTGVECTAQHGSLYESGYSPGISMYGTTGAAVAWTACTFSAEDCDGGANMNINYKETGTNGSTWWNGNCVSNANDYGGAGTGCTAGTTLTNLADNNPGYPNFRVLANTGTGSGFAAREVNEFSTIAFDVPGDSATGCEQSTSAAGRTTPVVNCARYVNFLSRNDAYTTFALQYAIGVNVVPMP